MPSFRKWGTNSYLSDITENLAGSWNSALNKKKKERKKHLDVPTNVFAVAFCVFAFWLKGFNLCMVKCESMHSLFYFMSSNYIQHNGGCRRKKKYSVNSLLAETWMFEEKSPLLPTNWFFTSFEWMITSCVKRHNSVNSDNLALLHSE